MSASSLLAGQIVAGRYAIQSVLGGRGATTTYHAITVPNRHVAVKLWDPSLLARQDVVAAVRRAEVVVSSLPQATVLEVVDSGCDGPTGAPYSVTDLSDHPSLAQLVELCPLTEGEMLAMLEGMAQAVDAARDAGISHLSLKPTNVFVGPPPAARVRVADFGATPARGVLDPAGFDRASAPWLAPEQAAPGGAGSAASDVFAAALVAFFAMTGRSYWRACREEPFDERAWRSELGGPRVAVSAEAGDLGVSLGAGLDEVFGRALAIDPGQRFASLGELAAAVREALGAPPSERAAIERALPVAAVAAPLVPPPPAWLAAPVAPSPPVDGGFPGMGPPPASSAVAHMASPPPAAPPWTPPRMSPVPTSPVPEPPAPVPPAPAIVGSTAVPPSSAGVAPDPAAWFADVAVPAQAPGSPADQVPISLELGPPPVAPPPPARSQTPTERPPRVARRGAAIAIVAAGALVLAAGIPLALRLGAASGAAASSATAVDPPATAASPTPAAPPSEQPMAPSATAAGSGSAAPAEGDAELTVQCAPECDGVLVKGRLTEMGKPQRLPPGEYVVTGIKARHRTQSRIVTLTPGASETVSFVLVPKACGKFLKRCD